MVPQLKDKFNSKTLPLNDLIFDRPKYCDDDKACKAILKTGEDKDEHNNKGMYFFNPKFNLIILNDMSDEYCDDEIIQMKLDQVAHIEDWKKIYILPTD